MWSSQVLAVFVVVCLGQTWGANYKISIHTANRQYAETDAEVFINIVGYKGETGTRLFLSYCRMDRNMGVAKMQFDRDFRYSFLSAH